MRSAAVTLLLATIALSAALPATAGQRVRAYQPNDYPEAGYVVAESRWGNGTVSGPVRRGPKGWQVRLPGGTWIDCVRSCTNTLRVQTVDFWQTNTAQPRDGGPDYFTWEFRF